jgi:hypothetical protein
MFEPYLHLSFSKVCVDTLLVLWISRLTSSLLFRLYISASEHTVQVWELLNTTCLTILILVIFVAQQLYERLGQLNFVWNIPIHRGTKCNCPQVSSSKGKAGGTQFVLVLFYSLRSIRKCNLACRHIPNQYGVSLFWLPYFEHIWSKKIEKFKFLKKYTKSSFYSRQFSKKTCFGYCILELVLWDL